MMNHPTLCRIDLKAITDNFLSLGNANNLMPVIKSDAYGHGLIQVANALSAAGAFRFAVNTVSEGIALREAGLRQEVVLLQGCLSSEECKAALQYSLIPVVGNFHFLGMMSEAAMQRDRPARIALKFNTGMSRLGFSPDSVQRLLDCLERCAALDPSLLLTHLASADDPEQSAFVHEQIKTFANIKRILKKTYRDVKTSFSNSAAWLCPLFSGDDIARPGFALYGGNPFHPVEQKFAQLRPAMSLRSTIIELRDLNPGDAVSYGATFRAEKPMKIAIIPAGYANGVHRCLSNKMEANIRGMRIRQVGTICMNMLAVDVSAIPGCEIGEDVWIVGGQAEPIKIEEVADKAGTIPYELMCAFGKLNPREWVGLENGGNEERCSTLCS